MLRSTHEYSRAGYNLILLFPIIGLGVIDQDVPAAALLNVPQLYAVGQVGPTAAQWAVDRHAAPPRRRAERVAPRRRRQTGSRRMRAAPGRRRFASMRAGGECS